MSDEGQHPASDAAPAPIDDGWEPEPERPPFSSRLGDGPVAYFRAVPARGFAWLGTVVFVGGWAAAVYVGLKGGIAGAGFDTPTAYRVQTILSYGLQATIAAGILWAVAAFLWVRVLPSLPDDATEA